MNTFQLKIEKERTLLGTRGNIYDRNGVPLAYNELAYSVTIEDNGDYDSLKEKNKEINKVISTVIEMVESNGDTVINDFGIILDHDNNYMYVAKSNAQRLRFQLRRQAPSNISALEVPLVQAEPSVRALAAQAPFAAVQRVGSRYWDAAATLGKIIVNGNPDQIPLQTLLDNCVQGITAPANQ